MLSVEIQYFNSVIVPDLLDTNMFILPFHFIIITKYYCFHFTIVRICLEKMVYIDGV